MARFLVAGESLVDLSRREGEPGLAALPGGSPLNVAVGLARLGHDVLLATDIGDDAYGELIRAHAAAAGVRLTEDSCRPGRRTSSATVSLAADGSATYDFDLRWDLGAVAIPDGTDAVHVGSLGTWIEPGAAAVRRLVRAARDQGILVSYDPNARRSLVADRVAYAAAVVSWATDVDVVKASSEDLDFIAGAGAAVPWHTALDVVTDGAAGVWAAAGGRTTTHPAADVDVEDTVGAGDSFMAGLLDGLARFGLLTRQRLVAKADIALDVVIPQAIVAAGITCGRTGADPPTRADLDAALAAAADRPISRPDD